MYGMQNANISQYFEGSLDRMFIFAYLYIRVIYGMQNANKMHNFEGSLNCMFISISSYSK
jgi:hypothetical protein